jgi:cytochrome c oxidase subunit 3
MTRNMTSATLPQPDLSAHTTPQADAVSTGLWVFMGVASCLFSLFLVAYVMRLNADDASSIALPQQLLLATIWLLVASQALRQAACAAREQRWPAAHAAWLIAGSCTALFIATQLWAWHTLQSARVLPQSQPVAGFFYLLTAMHGLHVLGGWVAWGMAAPPASPHTDPAATLACTWRLGLCARYWHFLLLVWLALYAALAGVTPELVRSLCASA